VNSDGMGEVMKVSGGSEIGSSIVSGVGSVEAGATSVRAASEKIPPRVRPSELNLQYSTHQYRHSCLVYGVETHQGMSSMLGKTTDSWNYGTTRMSSMVLECQVRFEVRDVPPHGAASRWV
jgi:hypothetical protein